jgi:hypothetical protein
MYVESQGPSVLCTAQISAVRVPDARKPELALAVQGLPPRCAAFLRDDSRSSFNLAPDLWTTKVRVRGLHY